jgi:hypothetical protein
MPNCSSKAHDPEPGGASSRRGSPIRNGDHSANGFAPFARQKTMAGIPVMVGITAIEKTASTQEHHKGERSEARRSDHHSIRRPRSKSIRRPQPWQRTRYAGLRRNIRQGRPKCTTTAAEPALPWPSANGISQIPVCPRKARVGDHHITRARRGGSRATTSADHSNRQALQPSALRRCGRFQGRSCEHDALTGHRPG